MNFHFQSYLYIGSISILLIIPECGEENNYPDNGCTEIGCSDGFTLIIQPSDSLFQEGIYDVSLFNDGIGTSTCFFRVSNDSTECASGHCVIEENFNAGYMVGYPYPDRVGISYPIIWPEYRRFALGHLGDGNLHIIAAGPPSRAARHGIERCVYEPLAARGGSVSAEHGIGLEKQPWLALSRNEAELDLMRRLKAMLDPRGILNPGRVLTA